jgi:hypothetical protein
MPPSATVSATSAATATTPTQYGVPATLPIVSPAPFSCGTR